MDGSDVMEQVQQITTEFLPLGTHVHVFGVKSYNPQDAVHGIIASPLIPVFLGESNAMGYLIRLDQPIQVCAEGGVQGELQVIFTHYTAVSEIGGIDVEEVNTNV
ncbi:MAG: hypothetical protein ACO3F3_18555 [Gemmataceae bacterium]